MDEELLKLLGIGGAAIGGGLLTKEAIDRLSDIGEQAVVGTEIGGVKVPGAMELAQTGLEQAQFRPFTVTSATGGAFGVTPQVDPVTGEVTSLGTTMTLSPAEQALQNRMMGQAALFAGQLPAGAAGLTQAGQETLARGQGLLGLPTFGTDLAQQAAQRAYGMGSQFMGAAQAQPADINALRGQFAGQVSSLLGQQPSAGIGQFGQQALGMGAAGLVGGAPDVTQTFAGVQDPGVRQAAGGLAGQLMGAGAAERGMLVPNVSGRFGGITAPSVSGVSGALAGQALAAGAQERGLAVPDVSQTFAGLQAPGLRDVSRAYAGVQDPGVRTAAGQLAARGLGLGMAGLDTQAPADVEALRRQYAGLAGQAAGDVLAPVAGREADVYERIRATQRPEEERQRLALEERLAQQGRLGVRTAMYGGTPEQAALAQAQEEAQNRASLAAIQQAQSERQQALGTAQALGGMFTGQAGLSSQLQSSAQQRATQLSQLGLGAEQIQAQLESEGFGRQMQLGQAGMQAQQAQAQLEAQRLGQQMQLGQAGIGAAQAQSALRSQAQQRANELSQLGLTAEQVQQRLRSEGFGQEMQLGQADIQAAQAQSALRSQAQQRANELSQLGLSAEQVQSRMEAEGFGRQMQLAGAGLQAQQAQSALQSQAQQRAAQLSQLGLSAQQIESQLQSEGLGRAVTSAQQAAQLAQLAGGLQAQQAGLGAQYAGLGSNLASQRQALAQARQAQALQAMQAGQGMLGGSLGLQQAQQQLAQGALAGAYLPQAQLLNVQQAAQIYPQLQQRGQLSGAGLFGETAMSGLEARLIAEQAKANLIGNLGSGLLSGLVSPVAMQGGGIGSLLTSVLGGFGED